MVGSPLNTRSVKMFQALCGKKIMTNVTLMTTMWSDTFLEDAIRRERELKGNYFKEFLRLGATLARFGDEQASAVNILQPLVNMWRASQDEAYMLSMVHLQEEIINYNLGEVSAGRFVQAKAQAILERLQELLKTLAGPTGANTDDPELFQEIMVEITRLQVQLEEVQKDADHLHLEFASHIKLYITKMRQTPHPILKSACKKRLQPSPL